jgi:hypothetical protein
VYVVDRFVVVLGPGYRSGEAYDYFELPVLGAGSVRSAEARDLTGDGHDELVVVLRQGNDLGARHVWQVIAFDGEAVRPVWGVETRKEAAGGFIEVEVAVRAARRGGGPPTIEVTAGRAQGLDAMTYREAPAAGVEPILLPWGPIASRSYRWNGTAFAASGERPNPRYVAPAPAPPAATVTSTPPPAEPEPPPPPGIDALVDAFRRDRGIGRDVAARFRRTANVAEDPRAEQVMVFGKAVLVIGPGYRDGRGWLYYELPVAEAADVVSVDVADLTGDGRAEIVVRVRQALAMSRPASEPVRREVLLVHQLTPQGFPRLGAIEVAREMGAARIDNEVALARAGRGRALEIRPGRTRAWDAASWPFADGATGDGVEALLLPWRDRAPVRYRVEAGRLVR